MPISATYEWSEKRDSLKVLVPLKGISASKADVLVSATTLKVNFSPYLLDIVLLKEIDPIKHKATVKDGVLQITLYKRESELWGSLVIEGSKEEIEGARKEASVQQSSLNENLEQQRHERKMAEEKHSLRKQMKLEELERSRVENMKLEEKTAAETEVYEAFAEMQRKEHALKPAAPVKVAAPAVAAPQRAHTTIDSFLDCDDIDESSTYKISARVEELDELPDDTDEDYEFVQKQGMITHDTTSEIQYEEEVRYIPPPRSTGLSENADQKIGISFTPRVFPTPMRESKAAEEEDWVAKNRRHIKNHGVLGKHAGGNVSEEDPVWLKAKGDDFFRSGDMRSALNAYCAALDLDPRMLPCLANRSICYLRCGQPAECKADCTAALQLITDEASVPGTADASGGKNNAGMAVKLLMRRGSAACQLGQFTNALTDYSQANVKFQQLPGSQAAALSGLTIESLAADIARLKLLVDAESLKKEGDSLLAERKTAEALTKYNASLQLVPVHVSCLSNRAACRMASQDLEGCVADCSTAVVLLQSDASGRIPDTTSSTSTRKGVHFETEGSVVQQEQIKTMLSTILPPVGSAKRTTWTVKTLLRRGVALSQLGRLDAAVQDYAQAVRLDPANDAIKADLQQLTALRDKANVDDISAQVE